MSKGLQYEEQATALVQSAGLEVIERNFRCKVGEIDLICREGNTLVFVEVRYRRHPLYASAASSVTASKQRRIARTAQVYLQRRGWSNRFPCRFDVIAYGDSTLANADRMQWLKNAFTM